MTRRLDSSSAWIVRVLAAPWRPHSGPEPRGGRGASWRASLSPTPAATATVAMVWILHERLTVGIGTERIAPFFEVNEIFIAIGTAEFGATVTKGEVELDVVVDASPNAQERARRAVTLGFGAFKLVTVAVQMEWRHAQHIDPTTPAVRDLLLSIGAPFPCVEDRSTLRHRLSDIPLDVFRDLFANSQESTQNSGYRDSRDSSRSGPLRL